MVVALDHVLPTSKSPLLPGSCSFTRSSCDAEGYPIARWPLTAPDKVNVQRGKILAPRPIGTFETDDVRGELLSFAKGDCAEIEFLLLSHLIVFFPDGMSGGWEWRNNERSGKLSSMPPNTILFNPAHDYLSLHKRRSQGSCRALFLTIAPKVMDRLLARNVDTRSVRLVQQIGVDNEDVRRTLLGILAEMDSPGWNSKFYAETLVTLLLSQLIRCASNLTGARRMPYRKGGLPNWRLKRALELLEGDLHEAPSIRELARHLQLHPTSVCRAFKQSTGLPPHQYLLFHRINKAKEMMRDGGRSLTEIGLDCGFNDFESIFRRVQADRRHDTARIPAITLDGSRERGSRYLSSFLQRSDGRAQEAHARQAWISLNADRPYSHFY